MDELSDLANTEILMLFPETTFEFVCGFKKKQSGAWVSVVSQLNNIKQKENVIRNNERL